jgi:protein phosphatase
MLVMGGRTNQVGEKVSLEVYDTETSEWHKYPPLRRFRHSSWNVDTTVHVFGGFEHDSPSIPTDQILKIDILALFQTNMSFKTKLMNFYHNTTGGVNSQPSIQSAEERKKKEEQEKKASTSSKNFHLSPNVQVFQGKVQSIPIERLEESKIVGGTTLGMGGDLKKGLGSVGEMETLHSIFISQLLKPKEWSTQIDPDPNMRFYYRKEHIMALADECLAIVQEQPMVLRIRAPIKVFGDIHGQYQDLMRFFHLWGAPTQNGDIESYDYLFLGGIY